MSKNELKNARLLILAEIDELNKRSEAGEELTKEFMACGKRLDKLSRKRRRVDVMNGDIKPAIAIPIVTEKKYKKTGNKSPYKRYDISPEIRALAEENGIKFSTLRDRIFMRDWDEYRAATEKVPTPNTQLSVEEYKRLISEGWTSYRIIKEGRGTEYRIRKIKQTMAEEKELVGSSK